MLINVGDMIADIALVFHWSLSELAELSHRELTFWHRRAAERLKLLQG
jgi:hypothetical protein